MGSIVLFLLKRSIERLTYFVHGLECTGIKWCRLAELGEQINGMVQKGKAMLRDAFNQLNLCAAFGRFRNNGFCGAAVNGK